MPALHRIMQRCGAPAGGHCRVTAAIEKKLQNRDTPLARSVEHRRLTFRGA
uniref:Uncharacterized protein n=1 Tax=Arundo donax TaxID=35708 RepID=A0A0A9BMA1_ARUDO